MLSSPVYTTENECQDCYKCVRHCPVKAIRIVDGKASVIPEACVACGECVKVCPAHAKKIRSDLARLKELVASGATLYASVAPSFAGYFKGVTIGQIAAALKAAGFAGVSETAHGAESVSAHVSKLLAETDSPLVISSACPAAVDMVRKYLPGYAEFISPLPSPVRAHCRLIKEKYGNNAKIVFFGPCAAKKNESDAHPDELALAVIFPALEQFLSERGITFGEEAEPAECSRTSTPRSSSCIPRSFRASCSSRCWRVLADASTARPCRAAHRASRLSSQPTRPHRYAPPPRDASRTAGRPHIPRRRSLTTSRTRRRSPARSRASGRRRRPTR